MALARCGGRASVAPLLRALDDKVWLVRQAVHIALTNLTGMELPYESLAPADERRDQASAWRNWWSTVTPDKPPKEALRRLVGPKNAALGRAASASTTYKGPPDVLTDGRITSFGSVNPTYPTTFFEIEVIKGQANFSDDEPIAWRQERGLRALGALGGRGAAQAALETLGDRPLFSPEFRPATRAGIRALGRLGAEAGFEALIGYSGTFKDEEYNDLAPRWREGLIRALGLHRQPTREENSAAANQPLDAIVFINGSNDIPNTIGTVEQADRWRATYVVTDAGPA